jgi:lipoyl(octanoyl) transferase
MNGFPYNSQSKSTQFLTVMVLVQSLDAFGSKPWNLPQTRLHLSPQQLGSFETLNITQKSTSRTRTATLYDWSTRNPIPFHEAWKFQQLIVEQHFLRIKEETDQFHSEHGDGDTVLMLQHEPVYTLGTGSDPAFVLSGDVDVIRMDRGGEVTYHGPGQLVVYPILDLRGYHQDIHWYMRALEEAILKALHKLGIDQAERQDQVTGVWIGNRKVAAIGIKVRRWITMHGLAVNVERSSLANFQGIVPCGLEGRNVTCINDWLEQPLTTAEFAEYMKESMEEIFCIHLLQKEH